MEARKRTSGKTKAKSQLSAVDRRLDGEEYYEAFQLLQTLISRHKANGEFKQLVQLAETYGTKLSTAGQHVLAAGIGVDVVIACMTGGLPPSVDTLSKFKNIAKSCPAGSTRVQYQLFDCLLKWIAEETLASSAKSVEEPTIGLDQCRMETRKLHLAKGQCLAIEGEFGTAHGHFALCFPAPPETDWYSNYDSATTMDADGGFHELKLSEQEGMDPAVVACRFLIQMLPVWSSKGYQSELQFFVLRCVMIILCRGDTEGAEFLSKSMVLCTGQGLHDTPDTLPPKIQNNCGITSSLQNLVPSPGLQLSYFLSKACQARSKPFFDVLKVKYNLIIRRDPVFSVLLNEIAMKFFDFTDSSFGNH